MRSSRFLDSAELPSSNWDELRPDQEPARGDVSTFAGICIGLGVSALVWAILILAWYGLGF